MNHFDLEDSSITNDFYRITYLEIILSIFGLKLFTVNIFIRSFRCLSDIKPLCFDLSIFKDEKIRSKL